MLGFSQVWFSLNLKFYFNREHFMSNKIQLYSLATPNGQKASVALEEMEIPYEAYKIDIMAGDQFTPEFIKINPNSKIPAIVDPQGDHGKPLAIMESGAILIYLAEKSGKFLPQDPVEKNKVLQWLFFQVGSVGPMFGQFGHFYHYAGKKCEHPYPVERYTKETQRLLKVLDDRLQSHEYLTGTNITIADFATVPWVLALTRFYKAEDHLGIADFKQVHRWVESFLSRPKVKIGMDVCGFD